MKQQYGFTLAEMLIALVLIGVASAIVIPKFFGSTSVRMRDTKIRESVSVIKQLLSNAQNDSSALGQNWATYMQTQLVNQFSVGTFTTVLAGNGCSGSVTAGYTDAPILLKDGTIIRVLSNGIVGTQAGEVDICIDPAGATYSTAPAATLGRSNSPGFVASIDLTAQTLRMNLSPTLTSGALPGLGARTAAASGTSGTRATVGSLNLF